jgi:hypothetical protein
LLAFSRYAPQGRWSSSRGRKRFDRQLRRATRINVNLWPHSRIYELGLVEGLPVRRPPPSSHIDCNCFADTLADIDAAAAAEDDAVGEDRVSDNTTVVAEVDADSLALRQLASVLANAE